ncbi:hypothetical protein BDA96_01G472600 [Sorghum bicolor]|uniref:Uncharacterized protein n=2 Tax=Sorghum bicolor TaxID=4558 RepID=A0A921S662_SORBI|nr:protein NRT1/ PTR FAMILY 8.3 [Sorghum bicolor]KAG0552020.1 hypothetical protein BDA96_01G472600 [Sorghum bicolor]KXG39816.1 hypothetical protein SORBI_3001G444000 [Sorghum bicolor]|eukprot:XP_002465589.2 protein NRT1/ PTR FAMILY 8.3 [Sorghum bicolor]
MESQRGKLLSEEPLLENLIEGTSEKIVEIKGVEHHTTDGWRACIYILVTECFEELAYYGIQFNLVTFLKTVLHENNVTAARNYTNWQGTCYIAPLVGAIIADSYLGRYLTTVAFFTVYLVGMAAMSISASFPTCAGPDCLQDGSSKSFVFFLGLYLMAIGAGGIKPCVSSFGADQFDDSNPAERLKKDSFFNWFFFAIYIGSFVSGTVVVWAQDHFGWVVGLWIPTLFIALAITSFVLGSSSYTVQKPMGSPIVRVFQVIVAAVRKWDVGLPNDDSLLHELLQEKASMADGDKLQHTPVLRFLDKAAVITSAEELNDPWRLCTVTQVQELKVIIGMLPIWATGIVYFAVLAQFSSTFLEQGRTMDKQVGAFAIPPASLASFDAVSVIFWVPIYDKVIVPAARRLTGRERGLSELQRFGTGLVLSVLVMTAAALVETRRLALAAAHGEGEVPMSILWQVPQYFLVGASVVFACVGQTEFFYNEAPASMRSLCSALGLLTVALGSYLSSLVVTAVAWLTTRGGEPGWIPDDLNDGHLDRFFWLLAALSALNLAVFVCCAGRYRRKSVY